jgi:hypothetical protein
MKSFLSLLFLFSLAFYCQAQVVCIRCYDQNARVLTDTNNLIVNGGFENTNCIASQAWSNSFCPNSLAYNCSIDNWVCTGGGSMTYADMCDTTFSEIVEGNKAVYFGNMFCYVCDTGSYDMSCLGSLGCMVTGVADGFPVEIDTGYGGNSGVSLSQTVNGLEIGRTYVLEFWSGGESDGYYFIYDGLFAVDVGFGNIFLKDPVTPPYVNAVGRRFIIVFVAASPSHIIKFTNWGHLCAQPQTELILDDVRLLPKGSEVNFCTTLINEPASNSSFELYLNPSLSNHPGLTFTYSLLNNPASIIINNIDGKEVGRYYVQVGSTSEKVKLPELAKGVYVARLVGEGVSANVKFVVE